MPKYTVEELAQKVNGQIIGKKDLAISGASKIEDARPGEITFLANPKYRHFLNQTRAGAVIVDQTIQEELPMTVIRVDNAYYRFLQIFLLFNPPGRVQEPGIHPSAVIDDSSRLGDNISVGPQVVIGRNCRIGDDTVILPGCILMDNVEIGSNCLLYPLVSIRENCRIGNKVIIHNGAVIGSDGFGFAPHEGTYHKIPQVGKVVIEDEVEIGANCTIDRATMGETIIRRGTKLDNLIQIAHNVEVGEWTVIAAQSGISGSTKVGHHVMMAGQVGIVGHITIGDFAQIGAQAGVSKGVQDKEVVFGSPARPIMKAKRIEAVTNQLPDLLKRIKQLENEIEKLRQKKNS